MTPNNQSHANAEIRDLIENWATQREHVEAIEEAKKPETRARRIEKAARDVGERPARGGRWKNPPPETGAT